MFNITTTKTFLWRWCWAKTPSVPILTIYFTKSIWTLFSWPPWRWKQQRYEDVKMIHNPFNYVINFSYINGITVITNLYRTGTCHLKGQLLLWVPQYKSWQWASSPVRLNFRSVWSHYSQGKMRVHEFQDSALTCNFHKDCFYYSYALYWPCIQFLQHFYSDFWWSNLSVPEFLSFVSKI